MKAGFSKLLFILLCVSAHLSSAGAAEKDFPAPPFKVQSDSSPPSSGVDDEIYLKVIFSWQGSEDDFKFLVPVFSPQNLEFKNVAQAGEKIGTTIHKSFVFTFKPIQPGRASLPSFVFRYTQNTEPAIHSIEIPEHEFRIQIKRRINLAVIFLAITIPLIIFACAICWIRCIKNRRIKISESQNSSIETVESKARKNLVEIQSKISAADEAGSRTELINQASRVLLYYCKEKWGIDSLNELKLPNSAKMTHGNKSELHSLLERIEQLRFGGELIELNKLDSLIHQINKFIERQ